MKKRKQVFGQRRKRGTERKRRKIFGGKKNLKKKSEKEWRGKGRKIFGQGKY